MLGKKKKKLQRKKEENEKDFFFGIFTGIVINPHEQKYGFINVEQINELLQEQQQLQF